MDGEVLSRLRDLFLRLDEATAEVARRSGLACPPGCGACCLNPEVEATEVELAAMAAHLWEVGEAEEVLRVLEGEDAPESCVLYRPEAGNPRRGRCGHYAHRPTLCRLFAYAAVRDKAGGARLAVCRVQREAQPAEAARAETEVAARHWRAPLYHQVAEELLDIDSELGAERLPINEALRRALQREGWRRRAAEACRVEGAE